MSILYRMIGLIIAPEADISTLHNQSTVISICRWLLTPTYS